jgi:histone-lysine N-methyltransferase SETMAR
MESSEIERRTVMKFCFELGKTTTETQKRSGRPSNSTTNERVSKINEIIRENRRLTTREISNALNISFGSMQLVLTKNLDMRRVSAKFVPRLSPQEQKEIRLSISLELRDRANSDSDCFTKSDHWRRILGIRLRS